jgi:hypothetical protein
MVVQGEITVDFESQIEDNENSVYRKGKVIFFFQIPPSTYCILVHVAEISVSFCSSMS